MSISPVTGNDYWQMFGGATTRRNRSTSIAGEAAQSNTTQKQPAAASATEAVLDGVVRNADYYIEQARQHRAAQVETKGADADNYTPYFIPRTSPLPPGVEAVEADVDPSYFQGRKVVGYQDGLPVTEESPEEEAAAVADLTARMAKRGQSDDELVFVKMNKPIYEEPVGPLLGHHVVTGVMLNVKLTPVSDPDILAQLQQRIGAIQSPMPV